MLTSWPYNILFPWSNTDNIYEGNEIKLADLANISRKLSNGLTHYKKVQISQI